MLEGMTRLFLYLLFLMSFALATFAQGNDPDDEPSMQTEVLKGEKKSETKSASKAETKKKSEKKKHQKSQKKKHKKSK